MSTQDIKTYYDSTEHHEVRSDLTFAINIINDPKIAVDCGCGTGSDIDYLLSEGFKVHGFDVEDESISRCKKRFKNNKNVILSKSDFSSYAYPKTSH